MSKKKREMGLGIALLNGIVLGVIGILILITPFTLDIEPEGAGPRADEAATAAPADFVPLTPEEAGLDYVAGAILVLFSAVMFALHFRRPQME